MQELKVLTNHRYLLRSKNEQRQIAIIEAKSIRHAESRALQIIEITNLIERDVEIEVVEVDAAMHLPTFLDGYFELFDEPPSSTKH